MNYSTNSNLISAHSSRCSQSLTSPSQRFQNSIPTPLNVSALAAAPSQTEYSFIIHQLNVFSQMETWLNMISHFHQVHNFKNNMMVHLPLPQKPTSPVFYTAHYRSIMKTKCSQFIPQQTISLQPLLYKHLLTHPPIPLPCNSLMEPCLNI